MKCIRYYPKHSKENQIVRVTDDKAQQEVKKNHATYTNKSAWKATGRHYG